MPTDTDVLPVPRLSRWLNEHTKGRPAPRGLLRLHLWLYQTSGGRLGHGLIGAPSLILTTTGRRSGMPRSCALVYGRDGESFVVAASNDGADQDPGWLLNLRSEPSASVQVGRRQFPAIGRISDRNDPEYLRLGELMNAVNLRRYDDYQSRTSRPIPLVVLHRRTPPMLSRRLHSFAPPAPSNRGVRS
jgi:F420H(2)-dependent quinone reductase